MKREYDFSNGERGRFYRPNAKMVLPIYLNGILRKQLQPIAKAQGKDVGDVVNQIVKNQIQLMALLGTQKSPNIIAAANPRVRAVQIRSNMLARLAAER